MTIEIIGLFTHRDGAEHCPQPLSNFNLPFIKGLVQSYDRNGYDRMLIANAATWPDSIPFAAYISGITKNLKFMIAHRPGFVPPTMAARMLVTIDRLSDGRAGVHIITGGNDKEMEADGDFLTKERRYARSAEYVDILRRMWTSETPFDHDGEFYKFNGAFSVLKPTQPDSIPVFWGGSSPESIKHVGHSADVFALGIDTLERNGQIIEKVRHSGAEHSRELKYCLSARLIVADTESAAWAKAEHILAGVMEHQERLVNASINPNPSDRYHELSNLDSCLDTRLWVGITKATKGTKAVTSLVGTPEQVVDELMKYYDLGVRSFLLSGFDFLADPDELGQTVIPMLRARAADQEKADSGLQRIS